MTNGFINGKNDILKIALLDVTCCAFLKLEL